MGKLHKHVSKDTQASLYNTVVRFIKLDGVAAVIAQAYFLLPKLHSDHDCRHPKLAPLRYRADIALVMQSEMTHAWCRSRIGIGLSYTSDSVTGHSAHVMYSADRQ